MSNTRGSRRQSNSPHKNNVNNTSSSGKCHPSSGNGGQLNKRVIATSDDEEEEAAGSKDFDDDDLHFSKVELDQARKKTRTTDKQDNSLSNVVTQSNSNKRIAEEARLRQFVPSALDKVTSATKEVVAALNISPRSLGGVIENFPSNRQCVIHGHHLEQENSLFTPPASSGYSNSSSSSSPIGYSSVQDFSFFLLRVCRKINSTSVPLSTTLRVADIMCDLDIGEFVLRHIPNLYPIHNGLEYPWGLVLCDDGVTYNIDPILNVMVALQLHYCCKDGLDAEKVFSKVGLFLTVKGSFGQYHNAWKDKQFMSMNLFKAIQDDANLRPKIRRVAEGFKSKLRTKSAAIVRSLLQLKPDYSVPDQDTGVILRVVN